MFGKPRLYSVYLKPADMNLPEKSVFIQDGFSFSAFFLNIIWAIYHKAWLLVGIALAFSIILEVLRQHFGMSEAAITIMNLGFYIWFGLEANSIREYSLEKAGYNLIDIVSGKNIDEAQKKFVDNLVGAKASV